MEKCRNFTRTLQKEEYQEVVLPLCVLRRFDCLLQPTKQQVLEGKSSETRCDFK